MAFSIDESYIVRHKRLNLIIRDFLNRFYVDDLYALKCFAAVYINVLKMSKIGLDDEQEFLNYVFQVIFNAPEGRLQGWKNMKAEGQNEFEYSKKLEKHYLEDINEIKENLKRDLPQKGPMYYYVIRSFEGAIINLFGEGLKYAYEYVRSLTYDGELYVVLKNRDETGEISYFHYENNPSSREKLIEVDDRVLKRILEMF